MAEDWEDWYDDGALYTVEEPVSFTSEPYDFPADPDDGIGALIEKNFVFPRGFGTNVAADDWSEAVEGCENWYESPDLPVVVTGVITTHPRFYFKANGCTRDDEKYYGSYWIEDGTGGMFVLGDTKVAHFDMGDTVTLEVRATRTSFDQRMVYSSKVLEVERNRRPISFVEHNEPFAADDMNEVRRVTGTVISPPDNFGEFTVLPDGEDRNCTAASTAGCAFATLDIELSRRGITFEPGERVTLTGPIIYSFDTYALVLTRVGQIDRL
jgi:hypothetical protein